MTINKTALAVAYCDEHRKLLYLTRKHAKQIARRHPEHKTAYRCSEQPDLWHIGAPHPLVLSGAKTKDELKQPRSM
jgi:hypothetical protein